MSPRTSNAIGTFGAVVATAGAVVAVTLSPILGVGIAVAGATVTSVVHWAAVRALREARSNYQRAVERLNGST